MTVQPETVFPCLHATQIPSRFLSLFLSPICPLLPARWWIKQPSWSLSPINSNWLMVRVGTVRGCSFRTSKVRWFSNTILNPAQWIPSYLMQDASVLPISTTVDCICLKMPMVEFPGLIAVSKLTLLPARILALIPEPEPTTSSPTTWEASTTPSQASDKSSTSILTEINVLP